MEAPVRSSLGQWLRPGEGGGRGVFNATKTHGRKHASRSLFSTNQNNSIVH